MRILLYARISERLLLERRTDEFSAPSIVLSRALPSVKKGQNYRRRAARVFVLCRRSDPVHVNVPGGGLGRVSSRPEPDRSRPRSRHERRSTNARVGRGPPRETDTWGVSEVESRHVGTRSRTTTSSRRSRDRYYSRPSPRLGFPSGVASRVFRIVFADF